jgi:hypothetical protein
LVGVSAPADFLKLPEKVEIDLPKHNRKPRYKKPTPEQVAVCRDHLEHLEQVKQFNKKHAGFYAAVKRKKYRDMNRRRRWLKKKAS